MALQKSMPLQAPLLDSRTGRMTRPWIAWFEQYKKVALDSEFDSSSGILAKQAGLESSVESLKDELYASLNDSNQLVINSRLEELEILIDSLAKADLHNVYAKIVKNNHMAFFYSSF